MNTKHPNYELAVKIKDLAREAGFVDCGIIKAEPFTEYGRVLDERTRQFPEAVKFYEFLRGRIDPGQTVPWAKSIVVCVHWYGKYKIPESLGHISPVFLVDIRNPKCPDHAIATRMDEGLRKLGVQETRAAEIPARLAGVKAGVVRLGRNGFAYSKSHGSWVYLICWFVDAELPADEPTMDCPCPPECRNCLKGCPTQAITEPFVMRADQCVAYLTFLAPEPVLPALWEKMGTWVYGCDVCQRVCPMNKGKWESKLETPWLTELVPHLSLESLAKMDDKTYREIVQPNFWYIPPENVERWHRNARRAMEKRS